MMMKANITKWVMVMMMMTMMVMMTMMTMMMMTAKITKWVMSCCCSRQHEAIVGVCVAAKMHNE